MWMSLLESCKRLFRPLGVRRTTVHGKIRIITIRSLFTAFAQMRGRRTRWHPVRYNLQDLLTVIFPYAVLAAAVAITAACAFSMSVKHTIYSGLPAEWQASSTVYWLCLLVEFLSLA